MWLEGDRGGEVVCKMAEITVFAFLWIPPRGGESVDEGKDHRPGRARGWDLERGWSRERDTHRPGGGQQAWAQLKAVGDICKVSSNCFCFEVK